MTLACDRADEVASRNEALADEVPEAASEYDEARSRGEGAGPRSEADFTRVADEDCADPMLLPSERMRCRMEVANDAVRGLAAGELARVGTSEGVGDTNAIERRFARLRERMVVESAANAEEERQAFDEEVAAMRDPLPVTEGDAWADALPENDVEPLPGTPRGEVSR